MSDSGNRELDRCLARAESLRQELERFVYVVTHDLRAPLRAITHLTQWIEKDLGDNLPEEVGKNMDMLRGRVSRMDFLFQALLRYSRACRDGLKVEENVPVAEIVREALSTTGADRRFEVKTDGLDLTLTTDPMALEMVLQELFDNALTFAGEGKSLKVWAESMGDVVVFHVQDEGPGIPEKHREEVFEVFRTLQARDTEEHAGVGLALARKVVRLAGGVIRVRDEGPGTHISFSWRLEIPEESLYVPPAQ